MFARRSMIFAGLIGLLPAGLLPGSALAELRQHGNVVYTLPQGWSTGRSEANGTLSLWARLADDACDQCRIYIGAPQVKTGAPDKLLARNLRIFLDPDEPAPEPLGDASLSQEGAHKVAMQALKSGDDMQILLAVEIADRTQFFGFEADSRDEAKLAASLEIFARDVVPMITSARYLTEGAAPVLGAPEPGGVTGVWQGTGTRWSLGLDMMMKMDLISEQFVFWADGTFYDGTPPGGIAPFDRKAALRRGDMSWGNYRVQRGKVLFSYADGDIDERDLAGADIEGGFDCSEGATCYRVKPMPDGTKINGRIENFTYSGFSPGSTVSGGVHFASTLYFSPDGRWSYDSSSGASASFTDGSGGYGSGEITGGYASSNSRSQSGRYRVENGTVIRSFEDGSPDVVEMIFLDAAGNVMIGGDYLKTGG